MNVGPYGLVAGMTMHRVGLWLAAGAIRIAGRSTALPDAVRRRSARAPYSGPLLAQYAACTELKTACAWPEVELPVPVLRELLPKRYLIRFHALKDLHFFSPLLMHYMELWVQLRKAI